MRTMTGRRRRVIGSCSFFVALMVSCGGSDEDGSGLTDDELGIGEIDDLKQDGGWGAALTCKPLPDLPVLQDPEIVVSLDGLTLRLHDRASGFERVFPIGPGSIKDGSSLTPTSDKAPGGVFWLRLDKGLGREVPDAKKPQPWALAYECRFWWKDPDTGKKVPVFAGLPFLRLEGAPTLAYAIHGPIDSYTLPSGGRLRRGYVSHGCIRMEAADVLELTARLRGRKVPVRIQRAVERRSDGTAVDVEPRFLMSECSKNEDCAYEGGTCRFNPYALKGFCTAPCVKHCSLDRWGYPTSFCVADPEDDTRGICVVKAEALNDRCRRYPGFTMAPKVPRFNDPSTKSDICWPGSRGWVGSPCFSDLDCVGLAGGRCDLDGSGENRPGFCTVSCTKYCPDRKGEAGTFCVADDEGGVCRARCLRQDDCPAGYACTADVPRLGQPSVTASVCL